MNKLELYAASTCIININLRNFRNILYPQHYYLNKSLKKQDGATVAFVSATTNKMHSGNTLPYFLKNPYYLLFGLFEYLQSTASVQILLFAYK